MGIICSPRPRLFVAFVCVFVTKTQVSRIQTDGANWRTLGEVAGGFLGSAIPMGGGVSSFSNVKIQNPKYVYSKPKLFILFFTPGGIPPLPCVRLPGGSTPMLRARDGGAQLYEIVPFKYYGVYLGLLDVYYAVSTTASIWGCSIYIML